MDDGEKTYAVTAPSGRVWILRPLPKHFFLYYGQLPHFIRNRPASDEDARAALEKMTPEQQLETAIFIREAVSFACVNPKISLTEKGEQFISPFDISEAEFEFLSACVVRNAGALEKKS